MAIANTEYCGVHSSQIIEKLHLTELLAPENQYFRCYRLSATLSLARCRENRAKIPFVEALNYFDVLPPNVQPIRCANCPLAKKVEAKQVRFFNMNEVLLGEARNSNPFEDKEDSINGENG